MASNRTSILKHVIIGLILALLVKSNSSEGVALPDLHNGLVVVDERDPIVNDLHPDPKYKSTGTYHFFHEMELRTSFPGLEKLPSNPRDSPRYQDPTTNRTYQWNHNNGHFEAYGKNGEHIGDFYVNGEKASEAIPGKK